MAVKMCENCRYFGKRRYMDREPTGQCCRNSPDAFEVQKRIPLTFDGDRPAVTKLVVIESPFPGVWPGDVCGEWAARENDNGDE